MNIRQPQCPYCYQGTIVKDNWLDVFFCKRCKKEVRIEKFG